VINHQCPEDEKIYIHRIGRTARAGASGTAITLVDWDDVPRWKLICDQLQLPMHEPAETYSTSSHLYLELDIPDEAGGTLPTAERTRAGLAAEAVEDLGGRSGPRRTGRSSSGARSGSGARRRSGRGRAPSGEAATEAKAASSTARTPRRRRRTRGGRPVSDDGGSQPT
jgi:superfamily II DNA/RNA helicase